MGRCQQFFDAAAACRGCSCIHVRGALSDQESEGMWHHEENEQRDHTGDWREDRREHEAGETPAEEAREDRGA